MSVWNTYDLRNKLQKGVGLGFGARHYNGQSDDLLNTFSIAAYGLMDACIFCPRGQLGWQTYAYNLGDKRTLQAGG
jgi:hypothetical protein